MLSDNAPLAKHPSGLCILTDTHRMKEEDVNYRKLCRASDMSHGYTMSAHSIDPPSIPNLLETNSFGLRKSGFSNC